MPTREQSQLNIPASPTVEDRLAALALIEKRLELADENEHPMERMLKRDELLELWDWLQDHLEMT
jgi:hypothetical protein